MKKLLLVAALVVLPLFASAAEVQTLLTETGTLYTLEEQSPYSAGTTTSDATVQLLLTTRRGGDIDRRIVPATTYGVHTNAAMAYDSESGTLYIFWLQHTSMLESKLLFTSIDRSGNWSEPTEFGQPFDYRENLRIAVTRKVVTSGDKLAGGITVHATWWETDTHTGKESAQYAAIAIENGQVEVNFLDLSSYVNAGGTSADLTEEELGALRHPVLFPSAKQESVSLTFGDLTTKRLHRVRIFPVRPPASEGRIRIPVGRGDGGYGAPRFNVAANSTVNAIQGDDTLAFYVRDGQQLRYVMHRDGVWTESRTIALDEQITAPAAIDAIRRLVNAN